MMSCCSSDRWRGATLCLFFAGCAHDAIITDVTKPWSVCTGDDGGVTSRPQYFCLRLEWEDEECTIVIILYVHSDCNINVLGFN